MYSRHPNLPAPRARWLRVVFLALLSVAIWCWHYDRLTWSKWSVPVDYTGDSLEILARIKAAKEGDLVPFRPQIVSRLGAPFGANWSEYLGSDPIGNHLLGLLARLIGVNAASNAGLLLAHLTAALSFYFCARLLRHRWEWAFAGALLFSFSYFNLWRSLAHFWLTFTGTVPLSLLVCWLVAAGRDSIRRRGWRWLCYGTAVVVGISNPYNLFMFLQLLGWSMLARRLRTRGSAGLRLGLASGALALLALAAIYFPAWLYAVDEGGTPLLARNYSGTEVYALKPIELFLAPNRHHSEWLAAVGYRYLRWSDWRGETFSPYLGLVGAAGLLWMLVVFVRDVLGRRRRPPSGHVLPAIWIIVFSAVGGVNSILALYLGLQIFRATNRYSIFLLALALFFLVARLSRLTWRWRPAGRLGFAAALVALGLWDQTPRPKPADERRQLAEQVRADRAFGAAVEARLGRGAMVYQLPLLDFPEGRPLFRIGEYEHFRPYLATETLRFTYGARKGRARGSWQRDLERLPAAELVRRLERFGFSALYVHRRGFPDRAEKLLAGLAAAGRTDLIESSRKNLVVVLLQPSARSRPPLARNLTFGRGWYPRPAGAKQGSPRWAYGSAAFAYYNPFPGPLQMSLQLALRGIGPRTIEVRLNRRMVSRWRLDETRREWLLPELELRPGLNRIDLVTPEPAVRVSETRWGLRAFGLYQLRCQVGPEPAVEFAGESGLDDPRTNAESGARNGL